jgi:thiamine transport system ATP-binding protein
MLQLEHVDVEYDGTPAVRDVSVQVPEGQALAVLGPSGSGKSTLLRAVAGRVLLGGRDLAGVPTHRRGFALMFQDGQLFPHLTVAGNVGYALRVRRTPAGRTAARVAELLTLVGLEGYGDRLPVTLSGGERQRVALARALAHEPRALLLDEPLSALDAGLRERLAADLRVILRTTGTTTVLVTHEPDEAFAVADRMAVMRGGAVVQHGSVDEVWHSPADAATALFLGYARVLRGGAAATVLRAAGPLVAPAAAPAATPAVAPAVALRRSALTVTEGGPLRGRVESARAAAEQIRLVVEVDGLGVVDAVAQRGGHVAPGDLVDLSVDPGRLAVLAEA